MKSFKSIAALVIVFAMLLSSVSAFACANDTFVAFDVAGDAPYGKLYKCPELKGELILKGYADKVEWKLAFYEAEYPHRAIETLVLDGQETGALKFDGDYAKVNTKEVAEFWEAKDPYFVYNRLYSDFTGKFEPTTVLKTDYVTAPVAKDWVNVGFDKYVKKDGKVYDYSKVYADNAEKVDVDFTNFVELVKTYVGMITYEDAEGNLVYTEDFINGKATGAYKVFEDAIKNVSWLELTGPDYTNGGTQKFYSIDKIAAGANAAWYDELLVTDNKEAVNDDVMKYLNVAYEAANAKIEWKRIPGNDFELKAPYRIYEVLHINGVPMDGSEVEVVNEKVRKEEIVETKEDYADEFHMVEKPVEVVDTTVTTSYDYVIKPFDTLAVEKKDKVVSLKVVEDPLLEKVEKIELAQGPQYEVRFVKVSTEPGKAKLPYIWRYTGGYANPQVEWKVAFAEAAVPYEIYEEKFVDGKRVYEYRSTGEFATDAPAMDTNLGYRTLTVNLEANVDGTALKMALEDAGYYFYLDETKVIVLLPYEQNTNYVVDPAITIDQIIESVTTKFVE